MNNDPLVALRLQNDRLEAEIAWFKDTISQPIARLQKRFGLSRTQAAILAALAPGRAVSYDYLSEHCSLHDWSDVNTMKVQMCRIREKIKPITITTLRQTGYQLDPEYVMVIKAIIEGAP